jgi:hypothetical protein
MDRILLAFLHQGRIARPPRRIWLHPKQAWGAGGGSLSREAHADHTRCCALLVACPKVDITLAARFLLQFAFPPGTCTESDDSEF